MVVLDQSYSCCRSPAERSKFVSSFDEDVTTDNHEDVALGDSFTIRYDPEKPENNSGSKTA
jgi:hypothetical protein